MKRVYKSPATPERLRSYVKAFPDETWEHFRRRNRRGYREVKQQLLQDQHGLCAYCEISIKLAEFEDNVDGKDGTEIARLLHIKKAAVSRIRARALRHLQELLAAGRQRGERLC